MDKRCKKRTHSLRLAGPSRHPCHHTLQVDVDIAFRSSCLGLRARGTRSKSIARHLFRHQTVSLKGDFRSAFEASAYLVEAFRSSAASQVLIDPAAKS